MNSLNRRLISLLLNEAKIARRIPNKSSFSQVVNPIINHVILPVKLNVYPAQSNLTRNKSKKVQHDSDDEDDFQDDDASLSRDSKVVKFNATSMRTDAILKLALGVARNKIETVFYESKIRVNGKKIMKKSHGIKQGDEIDVIKSVSAKNPDHLNVSRVEIINVTAKEESILITARRFKSLLIENYEEDPYKASTTSDE
ncbi:mitochondrial transcription rescue factor 1 [Plutella xylostella]|uniref:mitochondrial transcription rescue factor 1 n=1 Tax=Plutella xylostella TaxID=51655 RepID=UPI00203296FD|nr:mitochondrial transcription rescue factor 1 [Plutella xylostella]